MLSASEAMTRRWLRLTTELRSVARRLGVTRLVQRVWRGGYEDRFRQALQAVTLPGDRVWDVGANVGLYTELFADWVGPSGEVVAFEPGPPAYAQLKQRVATRGNVQAFKLALGQERGTVALHVSAEGTTNSLVGRGVAAVDVEMETGDMVRREHGLPQPDIIKIDVEGYEEEVLRGLSETLLACRAVLCEVHFQILESRGRKQAPWEVERYLTTFGLTTSWIDSSHLGAYRPGVRASQDRVVPRAPDP